VGGSRLALGGLALILLFPLAGEAQVRERQRPIRVGNLNILWAGGGFRQHDHPTFSQKGFVTLGYQRRILRREFRLLPVWVRGGFDFSSETVDTDNAYSIWSESEIANGADPYPDPRVQERMSDFALRFELVADVLNAPNFALYGGGGFIIHIASYSNRGTQTRKTYDKRENFIGPSLVGGGRLFMKSQPWGIFSEVRYRRVYGRLESTPDGRAYFTDQTFDFEARNAVSIEGGLVLHW
jgi:hypothetical protein